MQLSDFDYELPPDLIAQAPVAERTSSRLLVLDRSHPGIRHDRFTSLVHYLQQGDLLVLNDTRVIPARLLGRKESGGKVEIFLEKRLTPEATEWECLGKSSRPLSLGTRLSFPEGLQAEILDGAEPPKKRIRFFGQADVAGCLDRIGHMPLPPYITRDDTSEDRERYQTVFSRASGALAAPTAGLHFSPDFLERIRGSGVEIATITLHVGLGTFLPVRVEDPREHRMHEEFYEVSAETSDAVNRAKRDGRRVVAVGTTVARTLESAWVDERQRVEPGAGKTGIFIYPGYRFRTIDALLTNFHLPKSTLLMLVSAFAGRERVLEAYRQAIAERYRFYSYGDCMLIV